MQRQTLCTIDQAFAEVLKRLRKKKSVSQEAFGFEIGLHRTYISQLERGIKSPTLKTIYKISRALEINLRDLMAMIEQEMVQ